VIKLKLLAATFDARSLTSGLIRMREMLVSEVLARGAGQIRRMRVEFVRLRPMVPR